MAYHIPALLNECITGLAIKPEGTYIDVTFGGGGHSRGIMEHLGKEGKLYSFDQDKDAYANRIEDDRFQFIHSNFRYLKNFARYYKIDHADGIMADLGVSFHHFDTQERGFSFRFEGPLDMRMNQEGGQTAADVINLYSEEELSRIFYLYGEIKNSHQIAKSIIKARSTKVINRTEELTQLLTPLCGRDKEKKDLARVFQALRIEVNDEMGALQELLQGSLEVLKVGGRLVILTYHSIEDRMVKNFLRAGNIEGEIKKDFYGNLISPWKTINNKVIVAQPEEVAQNPRSRSAKLRIAEKIQ